MLSSCAASALNTNLIDYTIDVTYFKTSNFCTKWVMPKIQNN